MDVRELPSVNALTDELDRATKGALARPILAAVARDSLEEARREIARGETPEVERIARRRSRMIAAGRPRRVINATGVLLHTNLGRAVISQEAAAAASDQATGYGNVEFDLAEGKRGRRDGYLRNLLASVTGAESAVVVNNNAGALLLALAALAGKGNVVVSRGELIEIGGSFRLPDLMAASGAALMEVGTTNRTRLGDYAAAAGNAAVLLKVHPSNYRVEGFTEDVAWAEVGTLAGARDIPFIADIGSGLLDTRTPWLSGPPPSWLGDEPGVRQTLEQGADVVLFSGDKLLGGPQAGIAVGRTRYIDAMARHPLARALRINGSSAAALVATLEHYAAGRGALIPFWQMASLSFADLETRHESVLKASGVAGSIIASASVPGAGSAPGATIASPAISIDTNTDEAFRTLAAAPVPVIGRRRDGALMIDLRSVEPADDAVVIDVLRAIG